PLILSSILIFITVTVDTIFVFVRLFQAFVWYKSGLAPLEFYSDLAQPTQAAKTFIMIAAIVIADAMIIYRLWIVWSHSIAIILFPILTLFGAAACGIGVTYQFTQYKPGENIFISQTGRWITSLFAATLCTNFFCTVCIAGKIMARNRGSTIDGGGSLTSIVAIVVESAAINSTCLIFGVTSYLLKSNVQFVAADTWSTISGISFMLINVRVGLGWAQS
ncbi:hypothetical protein BDQ12DRAFT_580111, partial [Crucibulum laeve]